MIEPLGENPLDFGDNVLGFSGAMAPSLCAFMSHAIPFLAFLRRMQNNSFRLLGRGGMWWEQKIDVISIKNADLCQIGVCDRFDTALRTRHFN